LIFKYLKNFYDIRGLKWIALPLSCHRIDNEQGDDR